MPNKFIPPRTDTATRESSTPLAGELLYDYQEKRLYYGNGVTIGGLLVGEGAQGHIIQDEGTPLTARASLNFVGNGVAATDDSGNDATIVTVTQPSVFSTIVVAGQNDVVADSSTDTLTLVAGANVTLTTDDVTDTITINSSSSGHIIQDEGTPLTARSNLNFVGGGVVATDDAGNDATVITISSQTSGINYDGGSAFTAFYAINFDFGGVV